MLLRRVKHVDVVLENVIGSVALKAADFHRVAFKIEDDAGAFAKDLSGTDARAARAEDIGREDGAGRGDGILVGDFFDE